MKTLIKSETFAIGLAMFSMFFGAGNIIFPLAVGQYAGDKNFFAIIGLILTAVIIPFAGVLAMILYDGDYRKFFGRIGRVPGFLLALVTITLLGPLGSTPRCIALAFSTLKTGFPSLSPTLFSAAACGVIFLFSIKKSRLLRLLGLYLTPVLLITLLIIIFKGFWADPSTQIVEESTTNVFLYGLQEGYNTMDLLAAFFFSSTILSVLKAKSGEQRNPMNIALKASLIGAALLMAVYIGFSYIAAFHGSSLSVTSKDELLSQITIKIAGSSAGLLVSLTVALACLTTAIALMAAFADFFQKEVFKERISYETTLIGSLLITFFVATFEFSGISAFLGPILQVCYPVLIILTFLNIAHKMGNFHPIKIPVAITVGCSLIAYFI